MIMTEKRIPWYIHIIFLTKNIRNFFPLYVPDYYTKFDEEKNTSKMSNDLLKNNCEFEGLGKFMMILKANIHQASKWRYRWLHVRVRLKPCKHMAAGNSMHESRD